MDSLEAFEESRAHTNGEIKESLPIASEATVEKHIQSEQEFITTEWENFANEGFDIFSINNGIVNRQLYYEPIENFPEVVIQLSLENGQEFSFKQEEEKKDLENEGELVDLTDLNQIKENVDLKNSDEEKIKTETEEKKEEENDKIIDQDNENEIDVIQIKENEDDTHNDNKIKLTNYESLQISPDFYKHIDEIKESEDLLSKEKFIIKFDSSFNSEGNKLFDSCGEESLKMLKIKENEIKNLNTKLNQQKYQNKLIMEENNKLLEVISIFKILQSLESNTNSQQSSPTNIFSPSPEIQEKEIKLINDTTNNDKFTNKSINILYDSELDLKMEKKTENAHFNSKASSSRKSEREKPYLVDNFTQQKNKNLHSVSELKNDNRNKTYIKTNVKPTKSSYCSIYKNKSNKNDMEEVDSVFEPGTINEYYSHKVEPAVRIERVEPKTTFINIKPEVKHHNQHQQSSKCSQRAQNKNPNTGTPNSERKKFSIQTNELVDSIKENKLNLNIINNVANTNNINNYKDGNNGYNHLINLLERYREMNDKLMSCLNQEDSYVKIDVDRRRQDVENLERILEYINSMKLIQEKQEHVIPFYLIDKRRLYENLVNYIYYDKASKEKEKMFFNRSLKNLNDTGKKNKSMKKY